MDTIIIRLVCGAAAIVAAVYLIWPQIAVWLDRVRQPVCAACRYPVAGAASFTCPECGSDLRHVGILTPGMMMRRSPGPRTWVMGWTFVWAVLGLVGAVAVSLFIDGRIRSEKTLNYVAAAAGLELNISIRHEGWSVPPSQREMRVEVKKLGAKAGSGHVRFPWPGRVCDSAVGTASPLLSKPFDSAAAEHLLRNEGATEVEALGKELVDAVAIVANSPHNSAGTEGSTPLWASQGAAVGSGHYTPWWVQAGIGGIWVALWVVGALVARRVGERRAGRRGDRSMTSPPVRPATSA